MRAEPGRSPCAKRQGLLGKRRGAGLRRSRGRGEATCGAFAWWIAPGSADRPLALSWNIPILLNPESLPGGLEYGIFHEASMFLSEAETEARLDDLRRQRAALDRAIAEHELYLDLGRRLARSGGAAEPARAAPAPVPSPDPVPSTPPESPRAQPAMMPAMTLATPPAAGAAPAPVPEAAPPATSD